MGKFKCKLKKIISILLFLTLLTTLITLDKSAISVEAGVNDNIVEPLGPVTSKDVIYQIITDRFYDGNKSNNITSSKSLFDDKNNDGIGDGSDLKLYQGGDFQGIIEKIPYLKSMGITAVWVSAPYENRDTEILDKKSDGTYDIWTSFHGYHASNYYTTNKHFGTMMDFNNLINELHKNDMKLVIDFVTNHSSRWKNPTTGYTAEDGKLYEPDKDASGKYAFNENGEPYDYNGDGKARNLVADPNNDVKGFFHGIGDRGNDSSKFGFRHKELGSLADYSQENSEVIKYLEDATLFWKNKGIDGIRHDATLHMNTAFVKGLKDFVDSDSTGPITHFGEFFIGRPDDKYNEYVTLPDETGVDNLDFEFYRSLSSTFGDFSKPMSDFANMLLYTSEDYSNVNKTVTFMDNHDVTRFGYLQSNKKVYNAALVALMTSRGTPNIYYGTEQYIIPSDSSDIAGRVFMQKAANFDTGTNAYKVITKLSKLRKDNDALAYGTTKILHSDTDVMIMKRTFHNKSVIVSINRQPDKSVTINKNINAEIGNGTYNDYLGGLLGGKSLVVSNGLIQSGSFTLSGGEVSVWEINSSNSGPKIGDVVSTMGRVGNKVYIYGDNLDGTITVKFDETNATVLSNSKNVAKVTVPNVAGGIKNISVTKSGVKSNTMEYNVISKDQVQVIFHVKANTNYGENIYVLGNIPELGNWNTNKCTESMMNPNYPEWFLPVSVPKGTTFEYKFIKKDANGNTIWESGSNRIFTSTSNSQGSIDTPILNWQ